MKQVSHAMVMESVKLIAVVNVMMDIQELIVLVCFELLTVSIQVETDPLLFQVQNYLPSIRVNLEYVRAREKKV